MSLLFWFYSVVYVLPPQAIIFSGRLAYCASLFKLTEPMKTVFLSRKGNFHFRRCWIIVLPFLFPAVQFPFWRPFSQSSSCACCQSCRLTGSGLRLTDSFSFSLSLSLRSAPTSRFISKTSEAFRHSREKISAGISDILRRPVLIVLRSGLAPVRKSIPPFENPQRPVQSALPSHLQSVGRSTTAQGEGAEAQM